MPNTKNTENNKEKSEPTPNDSNSKETLESLNSELASAKQELANFVNELEELQEDNQKEIQAKDSEIASLKEQLDSLTKELAEVQSQRDTFENKLQSIETAKILEARMSTLKDLGFLRKDEEAQKSQANKVLAMTNEAFDSYISELKDIFSHVSEKSTEEAKSKKQEEAEVTKVADSIVKDNSEVAASDDEVGSLIDSVLKDINKGTKSISEKAANDGDQQDSPAKEIASVNHNDLVSQLATGFTDILNYGNKKVGK